MRSPMRLSWRYSDSLSGGQCMIMESIFLNVCLAPKHEDAPVKHFCTTRSWAHGWARIGGSTGSAQTESCGIRVCIV